MIHVKCPQCHKAIKVRDEAAGRRGKCYGCGATIRIPQAKEVNPTEDVPEAAVPSRLPECSVSPPTKPVKSKKLNYVLKILILSAVILLPATVVWELRRIAPINAEVEVKLPNPVVEVAQDDSQPESDDEPRPEAIEQAKPREPVEANPKGDVEKTLEALIAAAEPSIVRIEVEVGGKNGIGSGFVVAASGVIITNHHVIEGATSASVVFANGETAPIVSVLLQDEARDIAILQMQKSDKPLPALPLATKRSPKGQSVVALGAPQGLSFSASQGIVSGYRTSQELSDLLPTRHSGEWVQTTTPISQGNSGGPVVNLIGEVIGMNTFTLVNGQNLNFAISAADISDAIAKSRTAEPQSLPSQAETSEKYRQTVVDLAARFQEEIVLESLARQIQEQRLFVDKIREQIRKDRAPRDYPRELQDKYLGYVIRANAEKVKLKATDWMVKDLESLEVKYKAISECQDVELPLVNSLQNVGEWGMVSSQFVSIDEELSRQRFFGTIGGTSSAEALFEGWNYEKSPRHFAKVMRGNSSVSVIGVRLEGLAFCSRTIPVKNTEGATKFINKPVITFISDLPTFKAAVLAVRSKNRAPIEQPGKK